MQLSIAGLGKRIFYTYISKDMAFIQMQCIFLCIMMGSGLKL